MDNIERDYYIKEVENKTITKIIFCVSKNIPLNQEIINEIEKSKCRIIEFGIKFNQPICDYLPPRIEKIIFNEKFNKFNQRVDNLPTFNPEKGENGLKKITFGYHFNQPVDNLPTRLQRLTFGCNFNQSVDNLPIGLKRLTFGYKFNQPVDNLPSGLQRLTFGYEFNQPLNNLPSGLQKLIISDTYNKPLNNLPASVKITRIKYY
jgi:hypothetical protein